MLIVDLLTTPVTLLFRGERTQLIATHAVMLDIERRTGLSILSGALLSSGLNATLLRTILHAFLLRVYPDCTLKEAGGLLKPKALLEIHDLIVDAFRASMSDPEPAPDDNDDDDNDEPLTWPDIWSEARYNLHLTDNEWLNMTPRMQGTLNDRRKDDMYWYELMYGQICADIRNHSYLRASTPFKAEDFLLHPNRKQRVKEEKFIRPLDGEMISAVLHSIPGIKFAPKKEEHTDGTNQSPPSAAASGAPAAVAAAAAATAEYSACSVV